MGAFISAGVRSLLSDLTWSWPKSSVGTQTPRGANPIGRWLRLLRLHPIRRFEVYFGVSDELRVAWMIDGFHSDDDVHQLWIVVVNVLDQFGLCIGWSGNENRTGVRN